MASEDGSPATTQEKDLEDMPAVPVKIPHSLDTQGQAADYGGWAVYNLAGTEQPQPILPFDSFRHRATILAASAVATAGSLTSQGQATDPGAGAVITHIPGASFAVNTTYIVTGSVYLDGTVTTADDDNMKLVFDGATVAVLNVPAVAGVVVPFGPFTLPSGAGPSNMSIEAVAAASGAAAVYHAQLTATAQSRTPFVYLGSQAQCLQKLAGQLPAGQQIIIENNQQLWMAPDGTDPVTVSVLAERWDSGS
jgi:hypothetical protein